MSRLSLGTCMPNFKSVALIVLNWSDWPVRCAQTHTHTDRHTSNENNISAIHSVHLSEIIMQDFSLKDGMKSGRAFHTRLSKVWYHDCSSAIDVCSAATRRATEHALRMRADDIRGDQFAAGRRARPTKRSSKYQIIRPSLVLLPIIGFRFGSNAQDVSGVRASVSAYNDVLLCLANHRKLADIRRWNWR